MHGVLHFEGKLWRTLPALFWRPGIVMREYIDGRRAKYISPVALFLFTVFVTFAIFNASGGFGDPGTNDPAIMQEMQADLAESDAELKALEAKAAAPQIDPIERAELQSEIAGIKGVRGALVGAIERDENGGPDVDIAVDPPEEAATFADRIEASAKKARANPGLALYKLQTNSYKFGWLLIPFSLPIMWLLFPFSRRFRMYDHLVVVTYSISVMTMLIVLFSLFIAIGWEVLTIVPIFYGMFHLYRSLRGAYRLSRRNAAMRTVVLMMLLIIPIALYATAILAIALV